MIPASTRIFMSQSLSSIARSLLCCLDVFKRCILQHSSRICDWLCGLLWLVGIVFALYGDGYGHNGFLIFILHFDASKCGYSHIVYFV